MLSKELFLAGFKFEGPFLTSERCKAEPGILAILRLHPDPDKGLELTNIYQSANLQASASLELSFFDGSAMVAALYTDRSNSTDDQQSGSPHAPLFKRQKLMPSQLIDTHIGHDVFF